KTGWSRAKKRTDSNWTGLAPPSRLQRSTGDRGRRGWVEGPGSVTDELSCAIIGRNSNPAARCSVLVRRQRRTQAVQSRIGGDPRSFVLLAKPELRHAARASSF